MSAYYFFDIRDVTNIDKMEEYRKSVFDTVEKYGGKYRIIGGEIEPIEGNWTPGFTVLVEFQDIEIARRWYNSPEYTDIKDLRIDATSSNVVLIDATVMPPQVNYEFQT